MVAFILLDIELAGEMEKILEYLKEHGEGLDTEISLATHISQNNVRLYLAHIHLNPLFLLDSYSQ